MAQNILVYNYRQGRVEDFESGGGGQLGLHAKGGGSPVLGPRTMLKSLYRRGCMYVSCMYVCVYMYVCM